jgi:hypothetical protein
MRNTHCKVSIGTGALGDGLADLGHQVVLSLARCIGNRGRRRLDRLLFELDRHGALNRMRRCYIQERARVAGCCSDGRCSGVALLLTLGTWDGWGRQHRFLGPICFSANLDSCRFRRLFRHHHHLGPGFALLDSILLCIDLSPLFAHVEYSSRHNVSTIF